MDGQPQKDSHAKGKQGEIHGTKAIVKLFEGFRYRHDMQRVFRDCMEAISIAISNSVDLRRRDEREAQYLAIVKRYSKDEVGAFCRVLAELTWEMDAAPADVLGSVFAALELQNKHAGQFFTPYDICRLMAELSVGNGDGMRATIEAQGFVRAYEPAVGAGAMVIALAETMRDAGINYQQHLHVTAVDVDARAAHMAFLQFSLLHLPAIVVVGNSLTQDVRETWYTPAHIMGGWTHRLKAIASNDESQSGVFPVVTKHQNEDGKDRALVRQSDAQLVLF